jgi:hypothetical protein
MLVAGKILFGIVDNVKERQLPKLPGYYALVGERMKVLQHGVVKFGSICDS